MSDVQQRIDEIVKNNRVVLFMKGTSLFPQCGFSSRAVAILDGIREAVRKEAMHHNVHRATHYSNGLPVRLHYKGQAITDPEGVRYRPDNITTMHPSGKPDAPVPPQNNVA